MRVGVWMPLAAGRSRRGVRSSVSLVKHGVVAQVRHQHHSEIERAVDQRAFQHVARRLEQLDRDVGKAGLETQLVPRRAMAQTRCR